MAGVPGYTITIKISGPDSTNRPVISNLQDSGTVSFSNNMWEFSNAYTSDQDITISASEFKDYTIPFSSLSEGITLNILMDSQKQYISNLSDGTNTYVIKDSNASNKDLSNLSNTGNAKLDWYGTCATAASTQIKVVDCSGFVLTTGAFIRVKFTYAQTYSGTVKLNVNSTGDVGIRYDGSHLAQRYEWVAGEVVSFTYDGTYWMITDGGHASYSSYGNTILTDTVDDTTTKAVTPNGVYVALGDKQNISNLVTSLSSSSTDTQYPSAKCVYDIIGNIETLLSQV